MRRLPCPPRIPGFARSCRALHRSYRLPFLDNRSKIVISDAYAVGNTGTLSDAYAIGRGYTCQVLSGWFIIVGARRASRLLSILTTLQARERVTAQALADENGVSLRTIYRDIE